MANLLTKETRKRRAYEYYTRIIALVAVTISGALLLGGMLLLPAYLYVHIVSEAHATLHQSADDGTMALERQQLTIALKEDQKMIERLAAVVTVPEAIGPLQRFHTDFMNRTDFKVHNVQLHYIEEKSVYTVNVTGEASSREVVVGVRNALEQAEYLTVIDFPIDNFTAHEGEYEVLFTYAVKD